MVTGNALDAEEKYLHQIGVFFKVVTKMGFRKLNELSSRMLMQAVKTLSSAYNTRKMKKEMMDSGHPAAVMVFNAWDQTAKKIQNQRYEDIGETILGYAVWKCLSDNAYRPVFIDFLVELSKTLNPKALMLYEKEPRVWKINYQEMVRKTRSKK